jgi:O-antigen ligase
MLLSQEETELKKITKDWVAQLLFVNGFIVIISYGLAFMTDKASVGAMLIVKSLFLLFSFSFLILKKKIVSPHLIFDSGNTPLFFCMVMVLFAMFTNDPNTSLDYVVKFAVPLLYVYYSISYLIAKYGIILTLKGIHWGILIIYSIPFIAFVFQGGNLTESNLYGYEEGSGDAFVSNHYGWSSTLYILSFIFVWKSIKLNITGRAFSIILLIIALFLLISSANRASWLSLIVLIVPFFNSYRGLSFKYKIVAILIVAAMVIYFIGDPNSGLNFAIEKSYAERETGESRFEVTDVVLDKNSEEPLRWILGNGLFNYDVLKGKTLLTAYHNSYWEILFGAGIPLFLIFMSFMFFRPFIRFFKYYSKFTLLIAPLIIIPFFEFNLAGGQFLFFPWFSYMFLLNAKVKFWEIKHPVKSKESSITV